MYEGKGVYMHYKGSLYLVLGLGVHEHAKNYSEKFDPNDPSQCYVVYEPLTEGSLLGKGTLADFWLRQMQLTKGHEGEVDCFNDVVEVGVRKIPRFQKIGIPRFQKIGEAS